MMRPLFQQGIDALEARFTTVFVSRKGLLELEHELSFRTTGRAEALLAKVKQRLDKLSGAASPALRSEPPPPSPSATPTMYDPPAQVPSRPWNPMSMPASPLTVTVSVAVHPASGVAREVDEPPTATAGDPRNKGLPPAFTPPLGPAKPTSSVVQLDIFRDSPVETPTATAQRDAAWGTSSSPALSTVPTGALLLDRYEVGPLLGEGGMGRVFRAHDRSAGRPVALKMVRDRSERDRAALRNEVQVLIKLDRPDYFPRVYEAFEHDGLFVVPMDLIEGRNLRDHMLATPLLDLDRAAILRIFDRICDRLHYLHNVSANPILFKDLKPSNVMILTDTLDVRLIDFGLSAVAGRVAVDGGTIGFWAPECEADGRYSVQSDVFALGRLMLCLVLGAPSLSQEALTSRTVPLGRDRALPETIFEALSKLTADNPGDRPQTVRIARDLVHAALEASRSGDGTRAAFPCESCGHEEPRQFFLCAGCGRWRKELPAPRSPIAPSERSEFLRHASAILTTPTVTPQRRLALVEQAARLRRTPPYDELTCLSQIQIEAFQYQREAALTVLSTMGGRAVLADEVGLGKTIEAGLILKEYLVRGVARRVLIVVPPGIRLQWRDELRSKFQIQNAVSFGTSESDDTNAQSVFSSSAVVVVISSYLARRAEWAKTLTSLDWDLFILDEAHHAKAGSRGNQLGRFTAGMRSKHMLLLTATPAQNDLLELFQMINLVRPALLAANPRQFQDRYGGSRGHSWRVSNQKTLQALLKQVMVRNRRTDVHKSFPLRRADTKAVPLTVYEEAAYSEIVGAAQYAGVKALALVMRTQQFCTSYTALLESLELNTLTTQTRLLLRGSHFKLRFFLEVVAPQLVGERKVLVFSRFIASQKEIAEALTKAGYVTVLASGTPADRLRALHRFRSNEDVQFLVTGAALSEGHNLQFARCMVNFDLPWNPQQIEQRIGRIQRLGSRFREVQVLNLFARNTVEDTVMEYIEGKLGMFQEVFGFVEAILGQFHEEGDSIEGFIREALRRGSEGQVDPAMARLGGERISEARERACRETSSASIFDTLFDNLGTSSPPATTSLQTRMSVPR